MGIRQQLEQLVGVGGSGGRRNPTNPLATTLDRNVLDFVVSTYELYSSHVMDSISPKVPLAHGKPIVVKTRVPQGG